MQHAATDNHYARPEPANGSLWPGLRSRFHCVDRRTAIRFILALGFLSGSVAAQDYEAKYLNQLRGRRFFSLAEKYCEDELKSEAQSARRASLVMELSRTLVEHGKHLPPKQRAAIWKQAEQVLFDVGGRIPEQEFKARIQVQDAVNLANRASFLRWQSEVTPGDAYLRERARQRIKEAQKAVQSAADRVRNSFGEGAFRRSDLRTILDLHAATLIMDSARLEEPNSAERIGFAASAEEIVKRLASTAVGNANRVQARVLYAECCRERGDGRRAISILDSAMKIAATGEDLDRIFAGRIKSLLYEQRPDEAATQLIKWRQEQGGLSGELHYLRMQSLTELWKIAGAAKDTALADALLSQMQTGANYAKLEVGGYWSFRCDRLLKRIQEADELGSDLAQLKRKAESEYAAGNISAAAEDFGRAAEEARRRTKNDVALQLFYQQGSLLVQDKQFAPAVAAFQRASSVNGLEPGRDANLMTAWCLGRLYQQKATKARREAYMAALSSHRETYKAGKSFVDATFMLASLQETRLQNTKAIELYRQVGSEHPSRYSEASAALARCYAKVTARLKSMKNEKLMTEWSAKAANDLAARIAEVSGLSELSIHQTELVIRSASVMLQQPEPNYDRAADLLSRGEKALAALGSSPKTKQLSLVVDRWRLVTSVASGNVGDAINTLGNLKERTADELFAVIGMLDEIAGGSEQARLMMSELRLRVGEAAVSKAKQLPLSRQLRLSAWMVGTYFDHGRRADGLRQAQQLINQSKDRLLLSKTAALVQKQRTKEGQTLARKGWKKLENVSDAGSGTWLNARLHVAECTLALGEVAECRKLLKVTKLLYPDLGDANIRAAFRSLESQLVE